MQILDFAMQMERDGEKYYRDLALRSSHKGLAAILTRLADAEVRHYEVLNWMKSGGKAELAKGSLRDDIVNLFVEMQKEGKPFSLAVSEIELYRKAQDIEQKSRAFYLEKAGEVGSAEGRGLFLRLADEEAMHYQVLDSVIEFISRPLPGRWLENAEWYHSEEY